jgi:hypothetical protein
MNAQCGSCAIEERAALGYLLSLHRRPIESLVLEVTESRGFCGTHTRWFLRTSPNPRMPVLVYRYVIVSALRARRKRWRLPRTPCPACAVGEHAVERALDKRGDSDTHCGRHSLDDDVVGSVYVDHDAAVRAHLRNLQTRAGDGCDLCRARAEAEAHSLAASTRSVAPSTMCDAHLADLAFIDSDAVRRRTGQRSGEADCIVCRAGRQTEDLPFSDTGALCLAHAERFEAGRQKRRRAMDLRLEILAWELHELGRKLAWNGRVEELGVERDVWLRAPLLLDGRVALGRGRNALAQALGCASLTHAAGRVLGGDGARLEPPSCTANGPWLT